MKKVEPPNCIFFDIYSSENIPTGGVKCTNHKKCAKCGFNPVVSAARLENIQKKIGKEHTISTIRYVKKGEKDGK